MKKTFLGFILLWLILLIKLWQLDLHTLQNWVIHTYQLDNIQTQKLQNHLLTPNSWRLMQIFISIFVCSGLLFLAFFLKKISLATKIFLQFLQNQSKTFLQAFQNLSKTEKITTLFTFCLLNVFILYNLHHNIPHIDEAFSYVHFVSKGFIVSALYYPNPNNHIFFNLNVAFWDIFISNKVWAMRLPSFLSFLALQVLLFRYFLSHFSFVNALLGLLVFSLFSPIQAYAIIGRGYLLQMLFLWLSVHFWVKLSKDIPRKVNMAGFLVSAWAAFYTIPTFLYYFLVLGILAFMSNLPNFSKSYFLAKYYFGVLVWVGLTYFPILLLNGKENLFSESWKKAAQQAFDEKKYEYLATFGDFWIGIENTYWIFWLIIGLSLLLLGFQKLQNSINNKQNELAYFIPMPFLTLLIMFLQQTLIPERVWTALAISWVMLVVVASQSFKKYASVALALLIFAEVSVLFYQKNEQSENEYTNFVKVYPTIPFRKGEQIFSNDLVYQNLIAFYNLQEQKELQVDYSFKGKPYAWIIVEKNYKAHLPNGYFIWQETPYVNILKKLEP
jgi:hypothetical protein